MIDETMKELFCKTNNRGQLIEEPFGGKSVVYLGDPAQLPPVGATAVYEKFVDPSFMSYKSQSGKTYFKKAQKGQEIYRKFLMP